MPEGAPYANWAFVVLSGSSHHPNTMAILTGTQTFSSYELLVRLLRYGCQVFCFNSLNKTLENFSKTNRLKNKQKMLLHMQREPRYYCLCRAQLYATVAIKHYANKRKEVEKQPVISYRILKYSSLFFGGGVGGQKLFLNKKRQWNKKQLKPSPIHGCLFTIHASKD